MPSDCSEDLGAYPGLHALVDGVANHNLPVHAHARQDVREFSVTMSSLIEVHEVHVNGCPGQRLPGLSVQVQQWLAKQDEDIDTHFGRREDLHPGDHTDAA